jgi:tRNA uridine 5-carboxymethylaminomethyl modification enzyme
MAGINAVRYSRDQEPLILDRSQAYIGVLIDDLVTCGTKEPYRLFTSRAEYRLLLREDNADSRLAQIGYDLGLVKEETHQNFLQKQQLIQVGIESLENVSLRPSPAMDEALTALKSSSLKQKCTLSDLLRRPELSIDSFSSLPMSIGELEVIGGLKASRVKEEIELQVKFKGYIDRQKEQVDRFKKMESVLLPKNIDYRSLSGLSNEVVEKLTRIQPLSLGQASRISGITPAAISVLQVHLKKIQKQY